jgi:membrane-associated phospholipid phosphatase
VEHLTIRANTFPSGHVAGSLAVALAVMRAMPGLGLLLLFLAGSIAAACVIGRYHYIVDVVAGVLLTGGIWFLVT